MAEQEKPLDKLLPQGQAYLVFGEQALKLIQGLQDNLQTGGDWRNALQHSFTPIRKHFFQSFQGNGTHPNVAALWGLPLTTWQRVVSALAIPPGDAPQPESSNQRAGNPLQAALDKALGIPTLGVTREWQEQAQQYGKLWLAYQEVNQEYHALLHKAANRSLDLLQERLVTMAEEGKAVATLRELYNLWVDCSEAAYAELVRSPAYGKTKGQMINALMRFKSQGQHIVDNTLSAMNIPNRREVNTVHARLQEIRRHLSRLEEPSLARADPMAALMTGLQEEIKGLRQELNTLKAAHAPKATAQRHRPARKAKTGAAAKEE